MIRIYVDNRRVLAMLGGMADRASAPFAGVGRRTILSLLRGDVRRRFAERGPGWQNKADGTPATLRRTSRLYRSLVSETRDSVAVVSAKRIQYGTLVPYGVYHQRGTSRMPRRQFLPVSRSMTARIAALALRYIARGR